MLTDRPEVGPCLCLRSMLMDRPEVGPCLCLRSMLMDRPEVGPCLAVHHSMESESPTGAMGSSEIVPSGESSPSGITSEIS